MQGLLTLISKSFKYLHVLIEFFFQKKKVTNSKMDEDRCSLCDVMFTLKPSGRAYIKSKLTSRVIKGQRTSTLDVLKDIYDYKVKDIKGSVTVCYKYKCIYIVCSRASLQKNLLG